MPNKFRFTQLFIALALLLYASTSFSQQRYATIYRENGDRITGRWLGADGQYARIEYEGQQIRFPLNNITIRFATDLSLVPDVQAEKYFRNGEALLDLGMREEAKKSFLSAIQEFPKYAEAHYKLALLLQQEGKDDEAFIYLGHVVTINPEAYDMSTLFKQAGDNFSEAEEYQKAVDAYLLLFKHYPAHQDAAYAGYTAASLLAEQLGDVEGGLKILQEVIERFPIGVHVEKTQYLIGKLQSEAGQAEAAVNTLTEFIQNYPQSQWLDDAYMARGNAYLQLRQNIDALADFNTVYDIGDARLKLLAQKKRAGSAWMVYTVSDGLPSNQIQAIAVDGDTLWIGTSKGLAKIDVSMRMWQPVSSNIVDLINTEFATTPVDVRALAVDEQELWIGTLNHGVFRYDKLTEYSDNYTVPHDLPHKTVYDIKISGDEVWVGTFSGVARYRRSTGGWLVYNKEDDLLPADDIVALAVTPKTVWVGTSQEGIGIYDREIEYWRSSHTVDGLDASIGNSIVSFDVVDQQVLFTWYSKADKSNGYAIADWEGSKIQSEPVITYGDIVPIEDIYIKVEFAGETVPPRLWIATNAGVYIGVYLQDELRWEWDQIGYPTDRLGDLDLTVSCITVGGGVAWIGTSNGIARIDTSAATLRR